MQKSTLDFLHLGFRNHPVTRAPSAATESEIEQLEARVGFALPEDYKTFLREFGAGTVGPFPIYGVGRAQIMGADESSAWEVTSSFRKQDWRGVEKWLVISMDHSGNPVGLARDGTIWISDHDFGSIEQLAESFEGYLRKWCWELKD